jgi:hypothetical protein
MRVNIMSVRVHVCTWTCRHVLVVGVTSPRSCHCSPIVLYENTTNTMGQAPTRLTRMALTLTVWVQPRISLLASRRKHVGLVKNVGHCHKKDSTEKLRHFHKQNILINAEKFRNLAVYVHVARMVETYIQGLVGKSKGKKVPGNPRC